MVGLQHKYVQQSADRGDDDDNNWHPDRPCPLSGPASPTVDADGPTVLMLILFFLRALIGIVQSGFVALAATPRLILRLTPTPGTSAPANPYPFPLHYATPRHLGERWYVVYVGNRVGVFNEWSDVAAATSGVSGNSQRRFGTQAEAVASFDNALSRRSVRVVPAVQPNLTEDPAANPNQGNTGAHFALFSDPPDLKPRMKKEEPDDN
ncbi:hypothetical protein BD410DRAFT_845705 [Rickenella mellea]|uniref:Ribonuclease H1 N-terminal domain-containing protein n=1 Tax=Rickenella mellea TaxID=50990 RepID=A0A4Y7PIF3_9AGAM|nr:hypothetical protein BD410DRAFT_845705 [Rickenella mellea]